MCGLVERRSLVWWSRDSYNLGGTFYYTEKKLSHRSNVCVTSLRGTQEYCSVPTRHKHGGIVQARSVLCLVLSAFIRYL
jgi:hypothetical protein